MMRIQIPARKKEIGHAMNHRRINQKRPKQGLRAMVVLNRSFFLRYFHFPYSGLFIYDSYLRINTRLLPDIKRIPTSKTTFGYSNFKNAEFVNCGLNRRDKKEGFEFDSRKMNDLDI